MTTASRTASLGGISAHVEAYALRDGPDYAEIVLLSIVGTATACRAIWAGLLEGKGIDLGLGDRGNAGRFMADDNGHGTKDHGSKAGRYRTFRSLLPRLGLVHTVIAVDEALPAYVAPGRDFFVLTLRGESSAEEIARFKIAWDRAVSHPAPDAWAQSLLARGRDAGLVHEIEAQGCAALSVSADADRWAPIVEDLARTWRPSDCPIRIPAHLGGAS